MKKLFTLFALCAFTFSACDNGGNNNTDTPAPISPNAKLVITSPENGMMKFPVDGGTGEITFTLTDDETRSVAPANVSTKTNANWITDLTVTTDKVTFTVAANEGAVRSDLIYISFGMQTKLVSIEQEGLVLPDVVFEATHLSGSYFGKFLSEKGGFTAFNYFVILGDMQALHYEGKQPQATEYRFDLYSATGSAFNKTHRIPVGTYKIDHSGSGRANSIDGTMSCSYILVGEMNNSTPYQDATLVVTEDSIIADVKFFDGQTHHIEYHGDCVMEDYIENTYADVYPVSQYTSDILFDIKNGHINARFRGDYYDTGCDVWFVDMIENKSPYNGVYLILDLIVPQSLGGFDNLDGILGNYTIFNEHPESYEYTVPTGRLRDDSLQMHAWYLTCVNSQVDMSTAAPITSGTINVTKDGNAYVFEVNGTDDNGNKIIGTFSGYISELQDQTK